VTHYDVIEEVADELGWRVVRSMKGAPWDVLWTDHHIQPDLLIRLHLFQKVSHFPGIHVLSRKNLLGISLMDMYKRAPTHYDFFPKTWLLPAQYGDLRKEFTEEKTFIVKPEADCQGRGIFLTQRVEEVETGEHYVVQEYISRPLLIEGLKFDFRVYVLLCGVSPLRLYIYE
jgi:tubulin polyglutamylase TTLL6/13